MIHLVTDELEALREQIASKQPDLSYVTDPNGTPLANNPAQLRAVGRALAELDDWVYIGETPVQGRERTVSALTIEHLDSKEQRLILAYEIKAVFDQPFLLTIDNGRPAWLPFNRIPEHYADGETHTVYTVLVKEAGKPYRVSRGVMLANVRKFSIAQGDAGIFAEDPLYIHPLAHVPKDAFLARMLKGERFNVPESGLATVETFFRDQWRVKYGLSYVLE